MCRGYHSMVEMVESTNAEGAKELFCSSACVTAHKVQAVSSSGNMIMHILWLCWFKFAFHNEYCSCLYLNVVIGCSGAFSVHSNGLFTLSRINSLMVCIKVLWWNATTVSSFKCLSTTSPCPMVPSATSAPSRVWYPFRYSLEHSGLGLCCLWSSLLFFFVLYIHVFDLFQDAFNKSNSQNQLNVAPASLSTTQAQSASKPASTKPVPTEASSSGALLIPAVTKIPCAQCQRSFFRKPELLDFKVLPVGVDYGSIRYQWGLGAEL